MSKRPSWCSVPNLFSHAARRSISAHRMLQATAAVAATLGLLTGNIEPCMASGRGSARHHALRGVLWDIDGTLVQSTTIAHRGTNAVLRAEGLPEITEEQYHLGTRFPGPRRMAYHAFGNPGDARGAALSKQFEDLYIKDVSRDTVSLCSGLWELLHELRADGIRFSAVSNACGEYVRAVLSANELSELFECQYGVDDLPEAKPSGAGLLLCCRHMELHPVECIYVGDAPGDGLAAKAAGMRGTGVAWGSHSIDKLEPAFDEIVTSVDELRRTLKRRDEKCSRAGAE